MNTKIKVGETLYCKNGETVVVTAVHEKYVFIEYKGKIYTRDISIIGRTLFRESLTSTKQNTKYQKEKTKQLSKKTINQREKIQKASCYECAFYKREECFGEKMACKDFKYAPTISLDELSW